MSRLLRGRRVAGVDVARGVALVGMMAVHVFPAFSDDGRLHPAYPVVAGRAAALFACLAGVGLALATGGPDRLTGRALRAARAGVLVRALLLLVLGLLLGSVDSPPAVILAYYAVLFAASVVFLGLSWRVLAVVGLVWVLVAPLLSHLLRSHLTVTGIPAEGGLPTARLFRDLLLTGYYPALPWLGYLLAGLALGRLPLRSARVAAAVAAVGACLAVAAKAVSGVLLDAAGGAERLAASVGGGVQPEQVEGALRAGLYGTTPTSTPAWLLVSAPHSGTTFDLLHTIGTAMLVLGLCLLVTRAGPGLLVPLAAAGSMTLTLYSLHVLALARPELLPFDGPLQLWLGQVALALLLATLWRLAVGRGPLEKLAAALDGAARRLVRRSGPDELSEARRTVDV